MTRIYLYDVRDHNLWEGKRILRKRNRRQGVVIEHHLLVAVVVPTAVVVVELTAMFVAMAAGLRLLLPVAAVSVHHPRGRPHPSHPSLLPRPRVVRQTLHRLPPLRAPCTQPRRHLILASGMRHARSVGMQLSAPACPRPIVMVGTRPIVMVGMRPIAMVGIPPIAIRPLRLQGIHPVPIAATQRVAPVRMRRP